jgi:hypothetical protein
MYSIHIQILHRTINYGRNYLRTLICCQDTIYKIVISRETGNLGYTRRRILKQKTKTKHKNVIILKIRALLQRTGGKDEPSIVFMRKS